MKTVFRGKKISGLMSVVPETVVKFEDEVNNYTFPPKQTLRLQKVMGYKQHRVVKETTATSDLCAAGLEYMLREGYIRKEEIGGVVVACTVPDHFIPPVSSLLHGKFGLDDEIVCLDISQGCAGFLVGLMEAFLLLEYMPDRKVVVFAADVLSRKISKKDRNSYPLTGDAAGIAIVENDPNAPDIHFILRNRGDIGSVLRIPAGGSRLPCSPETAILADMDGDGNLRAPDNLAMKGSEVFNFVQTEVPPLIEDVLRFAELTREEIEWYFFHQPNRFMLKKLAEKLGVPYEKMPMNTVEEFGNSSGACIPVSITYNLPREMREREFSCCLSAFGSGLTWGAMTMRLGRMNFCEMLISDC